MSAACQYDSERSLNKGTLKATRSYYNWDTFGGRLHTIQSGTTGSPTSMQNLTYQAYDNNGNILRLDNPYEKNLSGTQVTARTLYTYDDLNRLIETEMLHLTLSTQYYLQGYGYDDLGRLETKGASTLTYNEPNGKLHAVSAAGSISYQYDANGNMTARNTGVPTTSFVFSYDSENRLSMATSSNTTVSFVYDGDGSRVLDIQTVASHTTTTARIGNIYEWISSSNWKKYYFAGSERIAFMKYSNLMYYLFSDHLGSTVVTRYQLGNVYRNGYYPFGEDRYTTTYTPYQFTGQRKEAAIGLYDYHARFYDPAIGRFVSPDTIVPGPGSPQSWDRYAYVNNNPVRYSDPSGRWEFEGFPSDPYWSKEKITYLIPKPGETCKGDCYDAYLTYKSVASEMGHIPTLENLLYMTADTEYASLVGYPGIRKWGQEGLARNYYEACFSDSISGCQGDQIYKFLSGYEPWSDRLDREHNKKTPIERAHYLIDTLGYNKDWLKQDVNQILDYNGAKKLNWTDGKYINEPWQWFGPFSPCESCINNVVPSISVDLGKDRFVWMLTPEGDELFKKYCP